MESEIEAAVVVVLDVKFVLWPLVVQGDPL